MAERLLASILHLTDLHLGKDFNTTPTGFMATSLRVLAANWLKAFTTPMGPVYVLADSGLIGPPHNKAVLGAVSDGIETARMRLNQRFHPLQEFNFDVTVVSGDILAHPFSLSPNSYCPFKAKNWGCGCWGLLDTRVKLEAALPQN